MTGNNVLHGPEGFKILANDSADKDGTVFLEDILYFFNR